MTMRYRVGFPGWKLAVLAGLPMSFRVYVHKDEDSGTFWAESPDLDGLVVTGQSLDELYEESLAAAHTLLELQLHGKHAKARADVTISSALCAA